MRICILEICPENSTKENIYNTENSDHYFITYKSLSNSNHSIGFNDGGSWGHNRNMLYKYAKSLKQDYDYYMFIDYDIELSKQDKPIEYIISVLDEYKPIMYRTSGFNDDMKKSEGFSTGGFINHSMTVLRKDVCDMVFPIPTKFGGFWDSASWINSIIVPVFEKSILVDYNIYGKNTVNSSYSHNKNYMSGIKAMNDLYLESKHIYTNKVNVTNNINEFKSSYMSNRRDGVSIYISYDDTLEIQKEYINLDILSEYKKISN